MQKGRCKEASMRPLVRILAISGVLLFLIAPIIQKLMHGVK